MLNERRNRGGRKKGKGRVPCCAGLEQGKGICRRGKRTSAAAGQKKLAGENGISKWERRKGEKREGITVEEDATKNRHKISSGSARES